MAFQLPEVLKENQIYFFERLEKDLQEIFNKLCIQHDISSIDVKQILLKNKYKNYLFDYMLVLRKQAIFVYCSDIVKKLLSELEKLFYIKKSSLCIIQIYIELNRPVLYSQVCSEVLKYGKYYGNKSKHNNTCILVLIYEQTLDKLTNLRTTLIGHHLISSLLTNNLNVHFNKTLLPNINFISTNIEAGNAFHCNENCNLSEIHKQMEKKAEKSKYRITSLEDYIILDINSDVKIKNDCTFNKNNQIYVKKREYMPNFLYACYIQHIILSHLPSIPNYIFHVIPHNKESMIQQGKMLFQILSDIKCNHFYLINQKVCVDSNKMDFLLTQKKLELESAFISKYGLHELSNDQRKMSIETLLNTIIKFDFLIANPQATLKFNTSEGCYNFSKNGEFVQYNYARISELFKSFEMKVKEGIYNELPPLNNVDFSLLKLDKEWQILHYIINYPKLLKHILDTLFINENKCEKLEFPSHKIVYMLTDLSKEFSIYYNKTKILTCPVAELQDVMYARLWLLKSVHQIMKNALNLLNLHGLERM